MDIREFHIMLLAPAMIAWLLEYLNIGLLWWMILYWVAFIFVSVVVSKARTGGWL